MAVKPVPDRYGAGVPYLIVKGAARAIEFYKQAFGATELVCLADPSGHVAHAEIKIGSAPVMLADEYPDQGFRSPQTLGGTPVTVMLYVPDVDMQFARVIAAGATVLRPVEDQFFGDRSGTLEDPFGHMWTIATHVEDVSPAEMTKRFQSYFAPKGNA